MDRQTEVKKYQRIIKIATVLLLLVQGGLLAALLTDLMDKTVFQYAFAGVFIVYAIVATVITQAITNASQ